MYLSALEPQHIQDICTLHLRTEGMVDYVVKVTVAQECVVYDYDHYTIQLKQAFLDEDWRFVQVDVYRLDNEGEPELLDSLGGLEYDLPEYEDECKQHIVDSIKEMIPEF